MKDESFELLTKLYAEFSSFRHETTNKLTAIDNRTIMIENEHGKKIEAAIDEYKQVYEKLLEHDKRFDSIDENRRSAAATLIAGHAPSVSSR